MAFTIDSFKANLQRGGARSTLFEVYLTYPALLGLNNAETKSTFTIRSATLPSSETGVIRLPYFGREVKMGGDRTFQPWNVRVINDEDFVVRNALESWSNLINTHSANARAYPNDYKQQATVVQYGKDGSVVRQYTFEGLFPAMVSDIALDWEDRDRVEEFEVTFEYDLWTVTDGTGARTIYTPSNSN